MRIRPPTQPEPAAPDEPTAPDVPAAPEVPADPLPLRLRRWQSARTWARLIREAEALWRVDVRALHRVASQELVLLVQEVPTRQRRRVNRWLERFHVLTRLL
jgi:hypothetical protein